jgi:hypothetical protein
MFAGFRIVLVLVFFAALPALAAKPGPCFPQVAYKITTMKASGISQKEFNAALDRMETHYAPIVKDHGYNLVIKRLWKDGTINSDTDVEGGDWVINSYGGLARFPGMTTEGYAAVACHELGHHMGGAPLYPSQDWASDEGESDYWATKECMKALGYTQPEITSAYSVLAKVLADLGGESTPTDETPDLAVKSQTDHEHPAAQCRFDTYKAGFLCAARGEMSATDPKVNACWDYPTAKTYGVTARPRCWFAP